jgi:short-subunit dehydrogenase
MDLRDKVAIVTGASRGLGVRMAESLARKGANVALAARSADDLEATAQRVRALGVEVAVIPTDVNKRSDQKNLVKQTTEQLGPPDVLVNNAGVEQLVHFHEMGLDDIENIITTNVIALEMLTRHVLPGMIERRRGHVVNIASMAGKTAVPYNTVYSSSKHAVVGFSWSLREEVRRFGVGVSVICPGFVADEGMFAAWSGGDPPKMASTVSPQDVADATVKAIEKNRAEVAVIPGLGKVSDVGYALSPDLGMSIMRKVGVYKFLSRAAGRTGKP